MPVTDEDHRRYNEFLFSVAKDVLQCVTPPASKLLWHYTDGQGLLGIVQSGSLYATQVSCLNDAAEIRYASRIFKSALAKLKVESKNDDSEILGEATKYFGTDENSDFPGTLPYFVACLSELED